MIYIEIISASDPLALGLYEYEFDRISIGRAKKNDIIILDKELPLLYLTLEVIKDKSEDQLIIRSLSRFPFFYVNGKKISGVFKIYPNDTIAFGENTIRIQNAKKTREEQDLTEYYKTFEQEAPELRFALEFIEEVLVKFEEKAKNV